MAATWFLRDLFNHALSKVCGSTLAAMRSPVIEWITAGWNSSCSHSSCRETPYLQFKQQLGPAPSAKRIDETLINYPEIVSGCFGKRSEIEIKEDVDAGQLQKGLGLTPEATRVELNSQPPSLLQRDIIRCATP